MALIPTHIRFALDVKNQFEINDISQYISGTVYPDSRWTTGIDRNLTHDVRFAGTDFPKSDFTLGWHVHCVCDEIQMEIHHQLYEQAMEMPTMERWMLFSVAKVIQDMRDLTMFNLDEALAYLNYFETPYQEDAGLIKSFFEAIQKTYREERPPSPDCYGDLWRSVGLEAEIVSRLVQAIRETLERGETVKKIQGVYDQIIQAYQTRYCR